MLCISLLNIVTKIVLRSYYAFFFAGLYRKGLVYLDVPIADDDCIVGKLFY